MAHPRKKLHVALLSFISLVSLVACSSGDLDPESNLPRHPAPGTTYSATIGSDKGSRYYEASHLGEHETAFRAEKVDDEHWRLTKYEVDGSPVVDPPRDTVERVSLVLDAVVLVGTDSASEHAQLPSYEHPLRVELREIASGKKSAAWKKLLPAILPEKCPSAKARRRFVTILVKRAEDPQVLCAALANDLGALALENDEAWKTFAIEALASGRRGVVRLGLACAEKCSFDDSKLAVLRAANAFFEPARAYRTDEARLDETEQLELVRVTSGLSFDTGKAEILSLVSHRTDLFPAAAIAIVDATRSMSFAKSAADVLCAVIARGEIPAALGNHLEPAIDRLPVASERERCWKALDRARRKE